MKTMLIAFFLVIGHSVAAQDVSVSVLQRKIVVKGLEITENTTIDEVIAVLGNASRIHAIGGRERFHCYDETGLAFEIVDDGSRKVLAMSVTYFDDEDKKAATGTFTGKLMIDSFEFTPESTIEDIKKNTDITEMLCSGSMCASGMKRPMIGMVVAYAYTRKISQVVFILAMVQ